MKYESVLRYVVAQAWVASETESYRNHFQYPQKMFHVQCIILRNNGVGSPENDASDSIFISCIEAGCGNESLVEKVFLPMRVHSKPLLASHDPQIEWVTIDIVPFLGVSLCTEDHKLQIWALCVALAFQNSVQTKQTKERSSGWWFGTFFPTKWESNSHMTNTFQMG